ncbi:MAG: S-layer homology domain-containing protein [bacterium]|nr:S-layer homology domain-containing protein [bacterium]
MRTHYKAIIVFTFLVLAAPMHLRAADATGTITIEQKNPSGSLGEWTLIKPGSKRLSLKKESYTLKDTPVGVYTLLITPPAGTNTQIQLFLEHDLLDTFTSPQANFTLEEGMHIRLRADYTLSRIGKISITSQPPGIEFSIRGPNDLQETGDTPSTLEDMPEGLYSVIFEEIEDCPVPRPQSDRLEKDGRISFSITFDCKGIENLEEQGEFESSFEFVSSIIDGESVIFTDVPTHEWFAPYVSKALKANVMSGYRDSSGTPTGKFGPSDNINIAQLAKIANEIAGIDESRYYGKASNTRARGTWFEDYFVSAENLHWLVFTDHRLDPNRSATRAEVVATLLQALDTPRQWAHGNLFTDVDGSTSFAASIETGARDGLIGGYPDGSFRPEAPINRAEMAKMLGSAVELYIEL